MSQRRKRIRRAVIRLNLQTPLLQNLLEVWRKETLSEEEPFAHPQSPHAGLLHFSPAEHELCEHEVESEKTWPWLQAAEIFTMGI